MSPIGPFPTCWGELITSAPEGRVDTLFSLIGFKSTRPIERDHPTSRPTGRFSFSGFDDV